VQYLLADLSAGEPVGARFDDGGMQLLRHGAQLGASVLPAFSHERIRWQRLGGEVDPLSALAVDLALYGPDVDGKPADDGLYGFGVRVEPATQQSAMQFGQSVAGIDDVAV
jgi:hypothetical protein